MAFNKKDTERVWEQVYEPVIIRAGLVPVRVDREDDGTLIQQQIIGWLNTAAFIIADVTHERPNCYLEIGFAMGLNRYDALILTCRADHDLHSPKRTSRSPKVHFDLQGYNILWWKPRSLRTFRQNLAAKLARKLKQLPPITLIEDRVRAQPRTRSNVIRRQRSASS